jgi:SH3-domain binding protein 5
VAICTISKFNSSFVCFFKEAKTEFKELLKESIEKIKYSAKKLGNSINSAKPYYEARLYATQLSKDTQLAAANYDKAKSILAASKG